MTPKFRYYDQFNGCMVYSDKFKNLAEFFANYQMAVDGDNDPILEQYSQFSIKTGVDIYEGDVVKCCKEDNLPGDIIFKNGSFHLFDGTSDKYRPFSAYDKNKWERIGNIHEDKSFRC